MPEGISDAVMARASILRDLPSMDRADNPSRQQDEIEFSLLHVGPFLACRLIEDLFRRGRLTRDDAHVLLSMHAERVFAEIGQIDRRLWGDLDD